MKNADTEAAVNLVIELFKLKTKMSPCNAFRTHHALLWDLTLNHSDEVHNRVLQALGEDCTKYESPFDVDSNNPTSGYVLFGAIIAICTLIMLFGILGNCCVIAAGFRYMALNCSNVFMLSLAFSDLLALVCIPLFLVMIEDHFQLAKVCAIIMYIRRFGLLTTALTLAATSCDRYLTICHPLRAKVFITRTKARKAVILIWVISAILCIPFGAVVKQQTLEDGNTICTSRMTSLHRAWRIAWITYAPFVLFLGPVTVMAGLYGKICCTLLRRKQDMVNGGKMTQKAQHDCSTNNALKPPDGLRMNLLCREVEQKRVRRIAIMFLVIIFAFALCWAPWITFEMVMSISEIIERDSGTSWMNSEAWMIRNTTTQYLKALTYLQNSINPIIYLGLHKPFRKFVKGILLAVRYCSLAYIPKRGDDIQRLAQQKIIRYSTTNTSHVSMKSMIPASQGRVRTKSDTLAVEQADGLRLQLKRFSAGGNVDEMQPCLLENDSGANSLSSVRGLIGNERRKTTFH